MGKNRYTFLLATIRENSRKYWPSKFKLLYGTGALRLNDSTRSLEQNRALETTIKAGVLFEVTDLLADVRDMVARTWKRESRDER